MTGNVHLLCFCLSWLKVAVVGAIHWHKGERTGGNRSKRAKRADTVGFFYDNEYQVGRIVYSREEEDEWCASSLCLIDN